MSQNILSSKIFKIKRHGQSIKVKIMDTGEIIEDKSLCIMGGVNKAITGLESKDGDAWHPSGCVGESTSEHELRTYIKVISSYYVGESNNRLIDANEDMSIDM